MKYKEPYVTLEDLLKILPAEYTPQDRDLVVRAYRVAAEAHKTQTRKSGEPYITHCVAVASILVEEFRVPVEVTAAALLHDTVEDTPLTTEDIERDFGPRVAGLVHAVTKLDSLPRVSRSLAASESLADDEASRVIMRKKTLSNENLRKIIMSIVEDPSVALIKLADRLHNMRTLQSMRPDKQRRIATETMDIFVPLANRLGLWQIKWQLEDLSFRYLEPEKYKWIAAKLEANREKREREIREIVIQVKTLMDRNNVIADVSGRPKHIYSIYRKMVEKQKSFEEVLDIRAVRIIVEPQNAQNMTPAERDVAGKQLCYTVLGIVHSNWRPIPGEFDDYIANPKDNDYQSLHTAVIYNDGKPLEVQIRTPKMHEQAEYGIAAHWRYKEKIDHDHDRYLVERLNRMRSMLDWSKDIEDPDEFAEGVKKEVFSKRIYVMTPKGDIIDLPEGATPIDFAYYIHTDIGHRCRGARVNHKNVPLNYTLHNGDLVEILTIRQGGPSRDWLVKDLGMIKTTRARVKIQQYFKKQNAVNNSAEGRKMLESNFRRIGLKLEDEIENLIKAFRYQNANQLYAAIGAGDLDISRVLQYLSERDRKEQNRLPPARRHSTTFGDFQINGLPANVPGSLARCCNPIPPEAIIGLVSQGRGVRIHRQDCPNILRVADRGRLIKLDWGQRRESYPVPVLIKAYDRPNLVQEIVSVISNENINLGSLKADGPQTSGKRGYATGLASIQITLEVPDLETLARVLGQISKIQNVIDVYRVRERTN